MAELSYIDLDEDVLEIVDETARESIKTLQETQEQNSQRTEEAYSLAETATNIAKGRNQALSYSTYEAMVEALNAMEAEELNVGQNIYIGTVGVPDLWVYGVVATKSEYAYESDAAIVSAIETNIVLQIGYYCVAFLEGQKVDLTNYFPLTGGYIDGNIIPKTDCSKVLGTDALAWFAMYANQFCLMKGGKNYSKLRILTQGTEEQRGNTQLILGNNIPTGTEGNSNGSILVYGNNTAFTLVDSSNVGTDNNTVYLPSKNGTLALLSEVLPLTGGTLTGDLNSKSIIPSADSTDLLGTSLKAWKYVNARSFYLQLNGVHYGDLNAMLQGTTEVNGVTILVLGNNIPSGEDGNAYGLLRMFGTNTGRTDVLVTNNTENNINVKLPSSSGTLMLKENIYIDDDGYVVFDLD